MFYPSLVPPPSIYVLGGGDDGDSGARRLKNGAAFRRPDALVPTFRLCSVILFGLFRKITFRNWNCVESGPTYKAGYEIGIKSISRDGISWSPAWSLSVEWKTVRVTQNSTKSKFDNLQRKKLIEAKLLTLVRWKIFAIAHYAIALELNCKLVGGLL